MNKLGAEIKHEQLEFLHDQDYDISFLTQRSFDELKKYEIASNANVYKISLDGRTVIFKMSGFAVPIYSTHLILLKSWVPNWELHV